MSLPASLRLDLSPVGDLAPRSGWILLALGAIAIVLAGVQFHSAHASRSQEADRLHDFQARIAEAGRRGKVGSTDGRDAEAATVVIRDLRVPWPGLLGAFEGASMPDVTLLAIEPAPMQRQVNFTAETKSVQSMLDYLEALMRDPLTDVTLISHQVSETVPGAPVRFQAQAKWKTD